jgi:8-oxo-dGTP pyrophosphatase MutT (NUDIX family)
MADARQASTVIVLRAAQAADPEVFLVKRHSKSGFFANAYVYPGGGVDAADAAPALLARARGADLASLRSRLGATPITALAHMIAAAREAFEEAGLLLASGPDHAPIPHDALLASLRARLNAGELDFLQVLEQLDAWLDLDALGYIAHWITPPAEPRRFDTRFFVAVLPPGQELAHDDRETVQGQWMTPTAALAAYAAGDMELAPPTIVTLEQLRRAGSLDAILAWSSAHTSAPIMPALAQADDLPALVFPGDPLFPHPDPIDAALPTHRLILSGSRWRIS